VSRITQNRSFSEDDLPVSEVGINMSLLGAHRINVTYSEVRVIRVVD